MCIIEIEYVTLDIFNLQIHVVLLIGRSLNNVFIKSIIVFLIKTILFFV